MPIYSSFHNTHQASWRRTSSVSTGASVDDVATNHRFTKTSKKSKKMIAVAAVHLMAVAAFLLSGSSDPSGHRSLAASQSVQVAQGFSAFSEWPTWGSTQRAFRRLCVHDARTSTYRRSLSLGTAEYVMAGFLPNDATRVKRFLSCNVGFNCTFDEVTGYEDCYGGEYIDQTNVYNTFPKKQQPKVTPDKVAYVAVIDECPTPVDDPSNPTIDNKNYYDSFAITKSMICNVTTQSEERIAGAGRRLAVGDGATSSKYDYTMYAIIHPSVVACPAPDGSIIDMATVFMDLGYWPKIWDEAIRPNDLADSPYKVANIPNDVGFANLVAMNAFRLTDHDLAVLVKPTTHFLDPIDEVYDDLLADPNAKASYVKTPNGLIDTGMLVIKPDVGEYEAIKEAYVSTPYDPTTGWDGTNIGAGGPGSGGLGTQAFLTYFYEQSPTAPVTNELDKCIYANRVESAGSCDAKTIDEVKVARTDDDSFCASPMLCDASNANQLCADIQAKVAKGRKDFENKHWTLTPFADRKGQYNYDRFLGYCDSSGKDGYHGMLDWSNQPPDNEDKLNWEGEYVREKEPKTVPFIPDEAFLDEEILACDKSPCEDGFYKLPDCSCSADPCAACPEGTRCQNEPGFPLMCIDCGCGFCDYSDRSCCESDATGHICKAAVGPGGAGECKMQTGFFPSFPGTGSICSKFTEITHSYTQKGCTCQPSQTDVCTYDKNDRTWAEACHICTADDIITKPDGSIAEPVCAGCKSCLEQCPDSDCLGEADDSSKILHCMAQLTTTCREGCSDACRKGYEAKEEAKEVRIAKAAVNNEPLPESKPQVSFSNGSPCEDNHCDVCDLHCTDIEDGVIKSTPDGNIQCCIGEKACFERQTYDTALGGSGVDTLCCRGHQSCYKSFIDLPTSGACCLASKDPDPDFGGGMVCQEAHFIRNQNSAFTGIIPIKCLNEKACYQTDFEGAGPVSLCCEEDGLDGVGRQGRFIGEDTDTCYQLGNNEKTWGPIGAEYDPPFESKYRSGPENGSKVHCASNTKGTSAKGKNCYQADFAEISGNVELCCEGGGNEDCKQVCDASHGCTCNAGNSAPWCPGVADPKIYGLDADAWGEYMCDFHDYEG